MTRRACLIYAHPAGDRSLANGLIQDALRPLAGVTSRSLYDLYPDFDIDVAAERVVLEQSDLVILAHPIYWYGMPALLKLWIDDVFGYGWAYGEGPRALLGRDLQWIVTAGGSEAAYSPSGEHGTSFDAFAVPTRQIARFCGMNWKQPLVLFDAHQSRDHAEEFALSVRECIARQLTSEPLSTPRDAGAQNA